MVARFVIDERVAHHPDLMRVGERDRRAQLPRLFQPEQAGHLAVAVEGVIAGKALILVDFAVTGADDGDAGARHAWLVVDERGVANPHARHVGDGIVEAGRQFADDDA
jgi:hypothetical protein